MPDTTDQNLLAVLLDSWDRSNTILVNLLRAVPAGALGAKPMEDSPTIAQLFTHAHFVRLILIEENAPEFARELPREEWWDLRDADRIAGMLNDSARAVREVVRSKVEAGQATKLHYDHPILFIQHMLWHEGYHHGQIKLTLKLVGQPVPNDVAGPLTWRVWMRKLSTS
jgi:uncharacterized damage-inducible protein DinB